MQPSTQTQTVDYSALKNASTIPRITAREIVIIIVALLVEVMVLTMQVRPDGKLFLFLVVAFFTALGVTVSYLNRVKATVREAVNNFAVVNNFQFSPTVPYQEETGTIFAHGSSKAIINSVKGQFHGLPHHFFEYNYKTVYGRTRVPHDVAVMSFTLPRTLPHMVIDSLLEPGGSLATSVLPITFAANQRIQLEGDFYKYFALYAPDKYGVSALSIIAPDVMETLMQHAALCDIEIIGNRIYFYWGLFTKAKNDYQKMYQTASAVLDQIQQKLVGGNVYAHESQAELHATPDAAGVRLAKTWTFGAQAKLYAIAISVSVSIFLAAFIIDSTNPGALAGINPALIVPIIIVVGLIASMPVVLKMRRQAAEIKRINDRFDQGSTKSDGR